MIHGESLASYNDGSYFVETRSSRYPNEWVKRDTYPRASLEVKTFHPCCQAFKDNVEPMILIQCKRKIHTRAPLVLAQELGEILAIGHNRHVNNLWLEKDREVIYFLANH